MILDELARAVAAEFEVAMGRPDRVEACCALLRRHLSHPPASEDLEILRQLPPLLGRSGGAMAAILFDLLEETARECADPWILIEGMLAARDETLARRALALAARLAAEGRLQVDRRILLAIAGLVETDGCPLNDRGALPDAAALMERLEPPPAAGGAGSVAGHLCLDEGDARLRRLAARILDLDDHPAPHEMAERLLGPEAAAFLRPYLGYTRATHRDLIALSPAPGAPPPALASLRRAESIAGAELLKEVIAAVGWARLNLGLDVRERAGVTFGGSLPLLAAPAEAALLRARPGARVEFDRLLFVAHGGPPSSDRRGEAGDAIAAFRASNLDHAALLADILNVAPLTQEKVDRMLRRMDRIVADFVSLFARHAPECAILPPLYADLRRRIVAELDEEPSGPQLSAELTRLVQAFEDPATPGEVRTLHGLKRYLHQRGLRLGFRLVEAGRATNRTVDLALASRERLLRVERCIQYIDFENERPDRVPFPVAAVVDGFARQLLCGHGKLPLARIFLYGNEVQHYLSFGNHPAFLRIDYSPPLQGGMIDLEYYGVSKYELSLHPNPRLDAIRLMFRRLDFDAEVETTRIHARYDKERAQDLGDLCRKASLLFCLVPYLMEVDWVIGSLSLDAEAKLKVAQAWAELFAHWGVLPFPRLLTDDRQGILERVEADAAGPRAVRWDGQGPYRDRFTGTPDAGLLPALAGELARLGLAAAARPAGDLTRVWGQIDLEAALLSPLREAGSRGEILETPAGFQPAPPERFQREHEAVAFARLLAGADTVEAGTGAGGAAADLAASAGLAVLMGPLERTLRFRTTGSVNGREVQRATLPLLGESIALFVLRDAEGIARLAIASRGGSLHRRSHGGGAPWRWSGRCDGAWLAALLRRSNILVPEVSRPVRPEEVASIREELRGAAPGAPAGPAPGERVVTGLRASPGRAVGPALFGTKGRSPEDLDGAILIAPSVSPADNTWLYHAAGIVSTGGGILSHAGLIATQFHKPALIIPGQWRREASRAAGLVYRTLEYREEEMRRHGCRVTVRRDEREPEHILREGDLVALDATEGTLLVLGQESRTLALHGELRSLDEADRRLQRATDDREILLLRGRRLRARHQVERILRQIDDPILARHAVREILSGLADARDLLPLLLGNPRVGAACRDHLLRIGSQVDARCRAARARALERIPTASTVHEVLVLRLESLALRAARDGLRALWPADLPGAPAGDPSQAGVAGAAATAAAGAVARMDDPLDLAARERLEIFREALGRAPGDDGGLRHRLRRLERLDALLGARPVAGERLWREARERLRAADREALDRHRDRTVLGPADGGFELFPLIGWKAANLSEIARIGGNGGGGLTPPWFVVTHTAFARQLDAPLPETPAGGVPAGRTLRGAIDAILARPDLPNDRKSALIRALWEAAPLIGSLAAEVVAAYRALARPGDDPAGPLVAVRSSAREEDAEAAARAGEFETFLFVRGEAALLDHVKRAWYGLWTERAIHNRAVLSRTGAGAGAEVGSDGAADVAANGAADGEAGGGIGGGVLIQRMARSRAAGVLQTANIAESEPREMVINAGLGLGEGIVSGAVAADHIVVAKPPAGPGAARAPLRFRYITADKREQVVFDERAGLGTRRAETLYHQRLRPALEYVDLCELVRLGTILESAYGYPLDIEFGIEPGEGGGRLWILQARPVPAFLSALRRTLQTHPLPARDRSPAT